MPTSSPLLQHPSQARIQWLNQASTAEALAWLDGLYEHSPWVGEQALAQRPFRSLAHLKWALAHSVMQADPAQQMALIKAHPLLAAKPNPNLTSESKQEETDPSFPQNGIRLAYLTDFIKNECTAKRLGCTEEDLDRELKKCTT